MHVKWAGDLLISRFREMLFTIRITLAKKPCTPKSFISLRVAVGGSKGTSAKSLFNTEPKDALEVRCQGYAFLYMSTNVRRKMIRVSCLLSPLRAVFRN
jgi:hypothetical protein